MNKRIAIIGGGNLGSAIAEGLIPVDLFCLNPLPLPEEILKHCNL